MFIILVLGKQGQEGPWSLLATSLAEQVNPRLAARVYLKT